MSETDSFIEEVSEEVRRDRLYGLARRYGWIVALAILALVGGTAYSEWSKSRTETAAQTLGDQILDALETEDEGARAAAVAALPSDNLIAQLLQAAPEEGGTTDQLRAILATDQPAHIADLARLKLALHPDTDDAETEAILSDLSQAGALYAGPAMEFLGFHYLETGARDQAVALYQGALQDAATSSGQIRRISELLVALGETPELANEAAPATQN